MKSPLFITVTDASTNDKKVYVNANNINTLAAHHSQKISLITFNDSQNPLCVKESPEQLLSMITEAVNKAQQSHY